MNRFLFLLMLLAFARPAFPAGQADSIAARIPALRGEERLQAYVSWCNLLAGETGHTAADELAAIRAYLAEARSQRDPGHEGNARCLQVFAYYNHGLADSLFACLPAHLEFMAAHRQWSLYYACRSVGIERLLYENKLQTAFREAEQMYDEAKERGEDYGLGISAYQIASCLYSMRRYEDAYRYFAEAERHLQGTGEVGALLNVYSYYWQCAYVTERYGELLGIAGRWQELLDGYCRDNHLTPDDLPVYYCYCMAARACAYMGSGRLDEARTALDLMQHYAEGPRDMLHLLVLREEARYAELCGDYAGALRLTTERLSLLEALGNRLNVVDAQETQARLLRRLGRADESAGLYADLLVRKDSLFNRDMASQINELSTLYGVDKLRLERKRLRLQVAVAVGGCVSLLVLLALYISYSRRLRRKDEALYRSIRQEEQARHEALEAVRQLPPERSPRSMQLFLRLEKLVRDEQLYLRPEVNREYLADRLATNPTYLAEAVRQNAGKGIREYLAGLRLEHAARLLVDDPLLPVEAIAEEAGFKSRSTFFRTFRDRFGMSPNEYRNTSMRVGRPAGKP